MDFREIHAIPVHIRSADIGHMKNLPRNAQLGFDVPKEGAAVRGAKGIRHTWPLPRLKAHVFFFLFPRI